MPWVASVAAARPQTHHGLAAASASAGPHAAAALLLLAAATRAAAAAFLAPLQTCTSGSSSRHSPRFQRAHRCYATAGSTPPMPPPPPAACRPSTVTGRPAQRLLIVGDGDFSFSRAILPALPPTTRHVVATCLHPSREELVGRYPTAAANLDGLLGDARVRVCFGVDATDLADTLRRATGEEEVELDGSGDGRFDRVVWNFPHCLGKANIAANRRLLEAFLRNAAPLLAPSTAGAGGGEVLLALCRGQSGVEARDQRAYKASWQLAVAAGGAGLAIVGAEEFAGLEFLYRPSGHRDQGTVDPAAAATAEKGDYVYHTRDPRIYSLVASSAAAAAGGERGPPLRPVAGPAFAHELHVWCHASLLALPAAALEERLRAAIVAAAAAAADVGVGTKVGECLAGLRFVESYRPPAGSPSSSPDPAAYPESRAYRLTWAWRRGGALTRAEADALRLAVESGVEGSMAGQAVVRRGKSFGVGDVTYAESGLWLQQSPE